MCGICGIVTVEKQSEYAENTVRAMCRTLAHRGPDDEGFYGDEHAWLGMRRLSIIDLDSGQQPMTNERRTKWLVFNGEIYNYREVRSHLEQKGHRFRTESDTETILCAYEEYGNRCVDHLNGMFAFAIWDTEERKLFIARDRLGIKPLYYWVGNNQIIFGSELKALVAHPAVPTDIDLEGLDHFLTLEYIPGPWTIFRGVRKLPSAHWLVFKDGNLSMERYWDIPTWDLPKNEAACTEMLADLLKDAVQMQMVSDVPLGAFLSGGIDSSSIVAWMSDASPGNVKTFSIGFDDASYNELPYARAVARSFSADHNEEKIRPDITGLVEEVSEFLDEPFGDFSVFPTYLVSKLARRSVKVVLSGDGGDELFGGYDTYVAQHIDRLYGRLPAALRQSALPAIMNRIPPQPQKKGLINKAKRLVEGAALPASLQHTRWMIFLQDEEKEMLYQPQMRSQLNGSASALFSAYFAEAADRDLLSQQQYVDLKTYLVDDILTKVDRMSMATSLEARVPLLDHRIVEFALSLPPEMKLRLGQTKRILRKAMQPYLPDVVLTKPKQGFSIPIKNWLQGPLQPMMRDLLSEQALQRHGYFQPQTVSSWVEEHLVGRANHSHRLWALMVFELWHRKMLERKAVAV